MSALFVYLIKVNIALIIFCLGYYLVLRPLTFYVLNRVYLVGAIIFATLYPLIDFEAILNRHQEIAQPVQVIVLNWQAPVVNAVQEVQHDKWFWLALVFWAGVVLLAVRFAMQLLSLYKLHRQSKPAHLHQYFIRVVNGDVNPFSFWRSIYINPDNHQPEELKAILAHEQVHVSEWHTIDILLGEVSTIFYWFNPGVWLMKRAIRENIEFITDQKILQSGSDPKAYQYSLLNVSFSGGHNAIVNHFNTSTIKKRILMMNSKRSSPLNLTRYAFLVPAVVVLVLVFSVSKAEFKKQVSKSNAAIAEAFTTVIEKIEPVTSNIAVVAKRGVSLLPDAVHVLFIDSAKNQPKVIDNSKLSLATAAFADSLKKLRSTSFGRIVVYGDYGDTAGRSGSAASYTYGRDGIQTDTSKKLKEVTVVGFGPSTIRNLNTGSSVSGDVVAPNGHIYFYNSEPVTRTMFNGVVITPHKMTPEEMEKLKLAGTATILPGGVIDISQQKVTKVKVNGVETSTSEPKVINIKRASDTTNKPLIIVNGNVASSGLINQNDIESVSVLKDASATSLYGEKGKNGVILITTRSPASESFVDLGTGKTLTTRPGFEKMYDSNGGVYYHSTDKPVAVTTTPRKTFGSSSTNPLKITNSTNKAINEITVTGYATSPNIFVGKLLIVNGKEMEYSQFSKIPADKIEVVKKASAKELKKYGDRANNGVLIITTTK